MAEGDIKDTEQAQSENAPPVQDKNDIQDADVIEPKEEKKNDDSKASDTAVENKVSENLAATVQKSVTTKKTKYTEVVADDNTITAAYNQLKKIFIEKLQEAENNVMVNSGKYLIKTFYDDDYAKAQKKPFTRSKSLNKLFDKIKSESDKNNCPQKSWLYNAIALAIRDKKYKQLQKDIDGGKIIDTKVISVVSSWNGKLTISHKIKLIHAEKRLSPEKIDELILEAATNNSKVLALQESIAKEIQANNPDKQKEISSKSSSINLFKTSLNKKFATDNISKFNATELLEIKTELDKIIKEIEAKLPQQ